MDTNTTPNWYIDELAYAGSEHLDEGYIKDYDHKAGFNPTDEINLFRELGLNQTHTVIDFGAGTGTFALGVAPHCKQVIAIDVSPAMLNSLKQKQGIHQNIKPVHAGFLSYQHEGDLADFIFTRHALHHLPDFWKAIALQRMASILKPDGVLYIRDLIFSCPLKEIDTTIQTWLSHASPDEKHGWTVAELETHIREEYSTFSWLLEPMLQQAGFTIHKAEHHSSQVFSAYTCIKS